MNLFRIQCTLLVAGCILFSGCTSNEAVRQGTDDGFYSYVDAQGNLVTIAAPVSEAPLADEAASKDVATASGALPPSTERADGAGTVDAAAGESAGSVGTYEDSEAVEQRLAEQDNQRFISYPGFDGQLVTEELSKEEMVAARQEVDRGFVELQRQQQASGYLETAMAVPANCCLALLAEASDLVVDRTYALDFRQQVDLISVFPAHVMTLFDGPAELTLRSFIRQGYYAHPAALFLDESGVPVLHVDNIFQRKFTETWYRFAYLEGTVDVPEAARYVVFYLGYLDEEGAVMAVPMAPQPAAVDAGSALAREGEVVVRGRRVVKGGATTSP